MSHENYKSGRNRQATLVKCKVASLGQEESGRVIRENRMVEGSICCVERPSPFSK